MIHHEFLWMSSSPTYYRLGLIFFIFFSFQRSKRSVPLLRHAEFSNLGTKDVPSFPDSQASMFDDVHMSWLLQLHGPIATGDQANLQVVLHAAYWRQSKPAKW